MKILFLLLVLWAINSQAQDSGDTIIIRRDLGRIYLYNGKKLNPRQMLVLMKPNPAAYNEMKRAKANYDLRSTFGFAGGFLIGWSIGSLISKGEIGWSVAGAGAGLIGVSIPFSIGQAKHTQKAVKLFNLQSHSPY